MPLVRQWSAGLGLLWTAATQRCLLLSVARAEFDMPRYFFNTRIGEALIVDPDGAVLRDPDHAWEVARATIRDLLAKSNQTGLLNARLEVTDESGEIVLEFPFTEAIGVAIRDRPTSH
jgi:hypothetical protein